MPSLAAVRGASYTVVELMAGAMQPLAESGCGIPVANM
jgi:hypothetical protein